MSSSFYNKFMRPGIKKQDATEAEAASTPKKKVKKNYCVDPERWNIGLNNSGEYEAEEALFLQIYDLGTVEEKAMLLQETRIYLQTQFRLKDPQQVVTDLVPFWAAGPRLLSIWFNWITGQEEDCNLAETAESNMPKITNLVADFLVSKKGDTFERQIEESRNNSREKTGNSILFHFYLFRELGKFWKNKSEKFIFLAGTDQAKDISEQHPFIHVSVRNVMGTDTYEEEVVVGVRIGDTIVYDQISYTEAIAAVVQLYFVMNLLYPPECDDLCQFMQRIAVNFGAHDGARNKRNQTRKVFKDFESFVAKFYFESKKADLVKVYK